MAIILRRLQKNPLLVLFTFMIVGVTLLNYSTINGQFTEEQKQQIIEKSHTYPCTVYESTSFVIIRFLNSDNTLCNEYVKSIETLKSQGFHIAAANNMLLFMEK